MESDPVVFATAAPIRTPLGNTLNFNLMLSFFTLPYENVVCLSCEGDVECLGGTK